MSFTEKKDIVRSQTNGVCSLSDKICSFISASSAYKKKDIYFSCSLLHAIRQINFEQKLGLHGDDEFIKLS